MLFTPLVSGCASYGFVCDFDFFKLMYSDKEKKDMYDVWVESGCVSRRAAQLYATKFPQRRHPHRDTIALVNRNLDKHGALKAPRSIRKIRPVRDDEEKRIDVLMCTQTSTRVGSRAIAEMTEISAFSVQKILKEEGFKPYRPNLVQELRVGDDIRRLDFIAWLETALAANSNKLNEILWTDESNFSNNGVVNRHNAVEWADTNPKRKFVRGHQTVISTNVWCGIVGDQLVGPYFFQGSLTGARYREFLKDILPQLLQNVPLNVRLVLVLQQDGAPCHNARIATNHLNRKYNQRWIGTNGPIKWPPRSPDLTPLDFFLWGYLKNTVYDCHHPPRTLQELQARIVAACEGLDSETIRRAVGSIRTRAAMCLQENGGHFEHLL